MSGWSRVRWTQASQVTELLDWRVDLGPFAQSEPQAYYRWLKERGLLKEAARFLGQALPRFEAVAWAAEAVRAICPSDARTEALASTARWLGDPSESNRRAAFEAAGRADDSSPARLTALAVFFSGGSMAPQGQPPLPPPRDITGRLAAGAVLLAALSRTDKSEALGAALSIGEAVASGAAIAG